jgi:cytochrome c oxidase subunit III
MSETYASHEFQYSSAEHQRGTALSGMWLFLATELLFFGALFLSWLFCRHWNQPGFDAGAQETELAIGTINTAILVTSSFTYSLGLAFAEAGNNRRLIQCCAVTLALGLAFLVLKFGLEWRDDIEKHLFPADPQFKITGELAGGAKLFFTFYFVSTGLHGLHMVGGIGLVSWIILRARRREFSRSYHTPVEVVGLYWSFVDMIWLILWPLIYLIGRG